MKLSFLVLLLCSALSMAQTQSASVSAPIRLAPEAAAALAEKKAPAVYPEKARASGVQGAVVLNVLVSKIGEVKEATVVSGDPALTQAAIDSIQKWKYKPYTVDGKSTPFETQVTFGFHIKAPVGPPPLGTFRDGKYENEFFGISYPLSTEWVRETTLMRGRLVSQGVPSSTQILVAALHVPARSDGSVADSSLVVMATLASDQGDANTYLVATAAKLTSEKMAKQRGEITRLEFAGITAYRADFKPSKGDAQYQAIVVAMSKGYLLRWNFLAISESVLDDVVATLTTISKLETTSTSSSVSLAKPVPSPEDAQAAMPVRMRVSSGVSTGLLIKRVEPKYPEGARSAHIQGTVLLHAVIDKMGNVIDLEAIEGPIELIPSSVNAVRQWKYRPYQLKGEPIELDSTIQVSYRLGR